MVIKKGDLFSQQFDKPVYIPHVTNNANAFYSGFVAELNKRWPASLKEKSPQWVFFQRKAKLGQVDIINVEQSKFVLNMCAQDNIKNPYNGCRLSYSSLMDCMRKVALIVPTDAIIVAPKFGSGIAGGNWTTIEKMIDEIWHNHEVVVYEL